MFVARVDVMLKKSVLDPQGQTVLKALHTLGFQEAKGLRVGKHFELSLEGKDRTAAEQQLKEMCEKLLINPVIEEYSCTVEEVSLT
jgi:phosphoribosylformylglycinamidine synthase